MAIRVTLRLDFDDERRLGPGKIALLEGVASFGSIAAAGRSLGMSYRRAWLLIAELNAMFSAPLVAARPGGKAGGGAALTQEGAALVGHYRAIEAGLGKAAGHHLAAVEAMLGRTSNETRDGEP